MSLKGAQMGITETVTSWPGVTAQPHHVLPETGWVSFYVRQETEVEQAIALLRESYEIAIKQKSQTIEVDHE